MPRDRASKALNQRKRTFLRKSEEEFAFSLLELVSVVVVLGILASITTPWVSSFIRASKIDSVKAKLNSAAATCLQDIREGQDSSATIDSNTISNELLESDGYKISKDMNSCSSLMIESSDEDDLFFFPMGFTIADGRLTKFAIPLTEDSERACKSWAGSNCKAGEELQDLIAHNKAVQAAKTTCNETFYSWLNGNPAGDGKKFRWDPTADSDCKRIPPANKSSTCTTTGCTLETWAFEGTIVNGEDGYKDALERKYGKICTEKLDEKLQQKYTGGPVSILECGSSKVMWFHKGIDVGSEEEMNKLKCMDAKNEYLEGSKKGDIEKIVIPSCGEQENFFCLGQEMATEDQYIKCENDNIEDKCKNEISSRLQNGPDGAFTPHPGKPGVCSITKWICSGPNGGLFDSEEAYKRESTCASKDPVCGNPPDDRCTDRAFRKSPNGKKICKQWAKCMGL